MLRPPRPLARPLLDDLGLYVRLELMRVPALFLTKPVVWGGYEAEDWTVAVDGGLGAGFGTADAVQ